MSFFLLVASLYTFKIVADDASETAAKAEFKDIANRISNGVLDAMEAGSLRNGSASTAPSTNLLYTRQFLVPQTVRGLEYQVSLSSSAVTVSALNGRIASNSTTFNFRAPATCTTSYAVCSLSGSVLSSQGRILIKYEFDSSANPIINRITIG